MKQKPAVTFCALGARLAARMVAIGAAAKEQKGGWFKRVDLAARGEHLGERIVYSEETGQMLTGTFTAKLTVNGQSYSQTFNVKPDPRSRLSQ